jgi:hypothetical protein
MGKGQSPTADELNFVHGLIEEGYSDTDIIKKYEDLQRHGNLGSLPFRQDVRFVRQRRKELEATKAVLGGHLKAVDPLIVKRKEEHFNHMAQILESIIPEKTTTIEAVGSGFVMTWDNGKQTKITKEQLAHSAKAFLKDATKQFGHTDVYEYLVPHLQAEIEGKELNTFINENPLKFYKTLRLLADKRIFKGKCQMCSDW